MKKTRPRYITIHCSKARSLKSIQKERTHCVHKHKDNDSKDFLLGKKIPAGKEQSDIFQVLKEKKNST